MISDEKFRNMIDREYDDSPARDTELYSVQFYTSTDGFMHMSNATIENILGYCQKIVQEPSYNNGVKNTDYIDVTSQISRKTMCLPAHMMIQLIKGELIRRYD